MKTPTYAYVDHHYNGQEWTEQLVLVTGDIKTNHDMSPLTTIPTRGYIAVRHNEKAHVEAGWFSLTMNGQAVIRRKVGGRNSYMFWSLDGVIGFVPDSEAK